MNYLPLVLEVHGALAVLVGQLSASISEGCWPNINNSNTIAQIILKIMIVEMSLFLLTEGP